MAILDLGYRDVWLMLTDGWSTLIDVWLTLTDSLLCIRYPYCNIFPSHRWDFFGQWNEGEWLVLVVYLMDLTSNIILGHILLPLMRFCLCSSTRMDDRCWLFTSWLWYQTLYWGIFSPSSLRILGIEATSSLILDWALVWDFQWYMILGPSHTILLR